MEIGTSEPSHSFLIHWCHIYYFYLLWYSSNCFCCECPSATKPGSGCKCCKCCHLFYLFRWLAFFRVFCTAVTGSRDKWHHIHSRPQLLPYRVKQTLGRSTNLLHTAECLNSKLQLWRVWRKLKPICSQFCHCVSVTSCLMEHVNVFPKLSSLVRVHHGYERYS